MIIATFFKDRKEISLNVSGHAGAAKAGHDIICASASILAYTVAQEAKNMEKRHQLAEPPYIRLNEGDTLITVKPVNDAAYADALHTFYVAQVGFQLLAYNHPQYVELLTLNETDTRS
ncbi:MAG: ribosomal-processing cysteine protease Prp [Christensenellaceae bacterium]|nr:ribosomal-processing cysteine protease Prp [Christensenellaceae bacterium]